MDYVLKPSIEKLFVFYNKREPMLAHVERCGLFNDLLESSLDDAHPRAWRATSLLGHLMQPNDKRIRPFVMPFIELLAKTNHEGHQRQLLIVLHKMQLNKDQKGHLFNHCLSIWEAVQKIPSTRSYAFKIMLKMTKSFPELKQELLLFTTPYYSETLSPGIQHSFFKQVAKLKASV